MFKMILLVHSYPFFVGMFFFFFFWKPVILKSLRYRVDLGPNIVANKRIDRMLDELQRCLGVDQAANPRASWTWRDGLN